MKMEMVKSNTSLRCTVYRVYVAKHINRVAERLLVHGPVS